MRTRTCVGACVRVCGCTCALLYVYIYMRVCVCVCVSVRACVCIRVIRRIHVLTMVRNKTITPTLRPSPAHTRTRTHTHTHTHTTTTTTTTTNNNNKNNSNPNKSQSKRQQTRNLTHPAPRTYNDNDPGLTESFCFDRLLGRPVVDRFFLESDMAEMARMPWKVPEPRLVADRLVAFSFAPSFRPALLFVLSSVLPTVPQPIVCRSTRSQIEECF